MLESAIARPSFAEGITLLVTVGVILDTLIKSVKGSTNIFQDIFFKCTDMFNYFIDETSGDVVQKLNAALGFILIFTSLSFITVIIYKYMATDKICEELAIWFISPLVALPITLIFCAKFTRHRYNSPQ